MEEKKPKSALQVKAQKKNLNYQRDKDREMVKGIFNYHECPGSMMKFVHKKYKGDPVTRYELNDGEVCRVPLGIAKHLNKNGWYPIHKNAVNENGKSIAVIGEKKQRFGFQSLEFIDPEDFATADQSIITVEKV